MARRRISFDVAINTPSAQREADRLARIFQSRLSSVQVGTTPGRGAGGAGGSGGRGSSRGGLTSGMPGSSLGNLIFGSAQFAFAGMFYQFFSNLPSNIAEMDRLATANKRAEASFRTLAGGTAEANAMIDAYIQGTGNVATRTEATVDAMRLFNIGMAQNADQMRVFTTLSRGMSQALGKDTGYIQEQLSLALANQSMLRFDQLGLSIERHQELMTELTEKYPEQTREIIFQNAMIMQATERYYNLALAQEALATSTEVANRQLKTGRDILAEIVSQRIIQPVAADFATAFGAEDFTLPNARLLNRTQDMRQSAQNLDEQNIWAFRDMFWGTLLAPLTGQSYQSLEQGTIDTYLNKARLGENIMRTGNALQGVQNMGLELDPMWVDTWNEALTVFETGAGDADYMADRLDVLLTIIEQTANGTDLLGGELIKLESAAEAARARIAGLNDAFMGAALGMIGPLLQAGASPSLARSLMPTEDQFNTAMRNTLETMATSDDEFDIAVATEVAMQTLTQGAQDWIDGQAEAERAAKRAASELESAAKAAEKAFLNAADSIMDSYDQMLQKIPGVFNTSKVTEEDLRLAELGYPVNYADDALRRLEDVAFNDKQRSDVDLGAWARALRLPEDTDPEALAIFARRAWESGELWANPENVQGLMNLDAAKGDLRGQELAALGQQNLRAFFGLGTEQGNEFLRVFGIEALDPIQDGLITEITTRGPIMGETLANAMHTGFQNQSLKLPWVQTLMSAIDSAVGRSILAGLNSNASSDLADAEGVLP